MSSTQLREPMLERYSHVFGIVRVYAPPGRPATWHRKAWRLDTERGGADNGPIREYLKAEHVTTAYRSPGLIYNVMRFK